MPASRHHIFAVLEFTQMPGSIADLHVLSNLLLGKCAFQKLVFFHLPRNGFTWRGQNHSKRHYSRDFTDEQVQART